MPIVVVGARETAASFRAGMAEIAASLRWAMSDYGKTLQEGVRAHASGRPGPNVISGAYRSSIGYVLSGSGPVVSVEVGSDQPYGRRLEFGFHGTDSIGRLYDQGPFPHFDPALDESADSLGLALTLMVGAL